MQNRIKELLAVAEDQDRIELAMLNNGFVAATKEYQANGSEKNLREWRGIRRELEDLVSRLSEKYGLEAGPVEDGLLPKSFDNALRVLEYLREEGWQISRTQLYEHIKDKKLRARKGVFLLGSVERYAKRWLKSADAGQKVNEKMERMADEKAELELQRERIRVAREQYDYDVKQGRYVSREDHELAIVGRAVAFMAHLNHSVQSKAADWIEMVGGDQGRVADLVEAIVEELEQRMGDFAADAEIDVIMEGNE
ncbi:MAG: hypothetical protein KQH59_18575 [Desulfobulbaceae bacterium]|nr:hypothetical protein [Desulfobulbaceae bacterium]